MDEYPVTQITGGGYYHFFGYYDKSPWNRDSRYLLAMRTAPFKEYMRPRDMAIIGVLDCSSEYVFRPVTQTTAWNWQQGSHAAWLNGIGDGLSFIYNVRTPSGFGAAISHAIEPGEPRKLPMPVYSVTHDSRFAFCLNFARLRHTHSTIGYALPDMKPPENHPADDGLFRMDLATGETRLILSLEALCGLDPDPSMENACHWITHVTPNAAGTRIVFLHRWVARQGDQLLKRSRLCTANPDGSNWRALVVTQAGFTKKTGLSHPKWFGDTRVMVWNSSRSQTELYDEPTGRCTVVGADLLTRNGHFSPCPANPDWMISDSYPNAKGRQPLFLYQLSTNTRVPVAYFTQDPELKRGGDMRCDLHPRWSRDGRCICVDSSMTGDRQMYLVDVSNGPHLM